jgi:hypothetical protein
MQVKIKNSTIPNAGKGLFAVSKNKNDTFKTGDPIVQYGNDANEISMTEVLKNCKRDPEECTTYVFCNGTKCWDDMEKTSPARYSNDCFNTKNKCNANFEMINGYPWLVANSEIKNNDEIFTSYGPTYWKNRLDCKNKLPDGSCSLKK